MINAGPDGNLWFTEPSASRIGRITTAGTDRVSAGITPGSGPLVIITGPDGNLWFTENQGARIGRITPSGTVTEFSAGITPGSFPQVITAGPDGNVWFTEVNGPRIGRITPSGTVTEFSNGITPAVWERSRPVRTGTCGSPSRADRIIVTPGVGDRDRVLDRDHPGSNLPQSITVG